MSISQFKNQQQLHGELSGSNLGPSSGFCPIAPEKLADLNDLAELACHQALKIAATAANFDTGWMLDHIKLPHRIVDEVLWQLKDDKLLEMLGQVGPLNYRFRITDNGLTLAKRLMDLCGYVGPMPVSLQQYVHSVEEQQSHRRDLGVEEVIAATEELTLDRKIIEIATLAYASNRSLFIFGPAGNGKSSLGRLLRKASGRKIWIPCAIAIDGQVIQFYDSQIHQLAKEDDADSPDSRWVLVEEPMVVSGGELTLNQLDLIYDPAVNFYSAPPHLKANCGIYFIDDLGRQQVPPSDLLNRWIIPLEQNIDYLTFANGKKIEIPFLMMLIVATNLKTSDVADEAFLRRMGYRIYMGPPDAESFRAILHKQAKQMGFSFDESILEQVVNRYRDEKRTWRASEPRDLLVRCADVCQLKGTELKLDADTIELAWAGYFSKHLKM